MGVKRPILPSSVCSLFIREPSRVELEGWAEMGHHTEMAHGKCHGTWPKEASLVHFFRDKGCRYPGLVAVLCRKRVRWAILYPVLLWKGSLNWGKVCKLRYTKSINSSLERPVPLTFLKKCLSRIILSNTREAAYAHDIAINGSLTGPEHNARARGFGFMRFCFLLSLTASFSLSAGQAKWEGKCRCCVRYLPLFFFAKVITLCNKAPLMFKVFQIQTKRLSCRREHFHLLQKEEGTERTLWWRVTKWQVPEMADFLTGGRSRILNARLSQILHRVFFFMSSFKGCWCDFLQWRDFKKHDAREAQCCGGMRYEHLCGGLFSWKKRKKKISSAVKEDEGLFCSHMHRLGLCLHS